MMYLLEAKEMETMTNRQLVAHLADIAETLLRKHDGHSAEEIREVRNIRRELLSRLADGDDTVDVPSVTGSGNSFGGYVGFNSTDAMD